MARFAFHTAAVLVHSWLCHGVSALKQQPQIKLTDQSHLVYWCCRQHFCSYTILYNYDYFTSSSTTPPIYTIRAIFNRMCMHKLLVCFLSCLQLNVQDCRQTCRQHRSPIWINCVQHDLGQFSWSMTPSREQSVGVRHSVCPTHRRRFWHNSADSAGTPVSCRTWVTGQVLFWRLGHYTYKFYCLFCKMCTYQLLISWLFS